MAIGDLLQVVYVHRTTTAQNQLNVLTWRIMGEVSGGASLVEIADKLSTDWAAAILPNIPASTTYQGLKLRRAYPSPTNFFQTDVAAGPGTTSGDALPPHCAYCLSLRSTTGPPKARGRIYLPSPGASAMTSDGRVTTSYRTNIITAFDTFLQGETVVTGGTGDSSVRPVVWMKTTTTLSYNIDNVLYRHDFASQVRRRGVSRPDVSII